jgi:hypothetical protein
MKKKIFAIFNFVIFASASSVPPNSFYSKPANYDSSVNFSLHQPTARRPKTGALMMKMITVINRKVG